jgi:rsbT co-antagonist protein RsbR
LLITLVAAFAFRSIDAMREASTNLSDELVPQLDAKGDFTTSMARLLGELEAFLRGGGTEDLTEAQESLMEAQDAVTRMGVEATDGDELADPEDIAANQRLLERQTVLLADGQQLLTEVSTSNAAPLEQTVAEIDRLHEDLVQLEEDSDTFLDRHIAQVTADLAASVQSVMVGMGTLVALCIGLVLLALFLLRRAIVLPVLRLADVTQKVANGRLDQTVLVSGGDEIGALQRSFNTMVATLNQQTQQLQHQVVLASAAQETAEAASAKLAEQVRTIEEQRAAIREISVPILPLSDHALVVPLVGTLDTVRLQVAQQRALQAIEQGDIRYALLDVTGVSLIDSQVAQGILEIIQAARLLGTEVVVVGVGPEVAQAIVGIGMDLRQITVRSTLQDGIIYALSPR